MKKFFALTVALVVFSGCLRQELQVQEYHIPGMTNPEVATYIESKVKGLAGVKEVSSNIKDNLFIVSYESSTIRSMNIEETIAVLGFAVNNRPAKTNLLKGSN